MFIHQDLFFHILVKRVKKNMEKILDRLKTISIIAFILALLSLTWLIIDYLVLKNIFGSIIDAHNLEGTLLLISGIATLLFTIVVLILLYYVLRVIMKYKSEKKKKEQATDINDKSSQTPDKTQLWKKLD